MMDPRWILVLYGWMMWCPTRFYQCVTNICDAISLTTGTWQFAAMLSLLLLSVPPTVGWLMKAMKFVTNFLDLSASNETFEILTTELLKNPSNTSAWKSFARFFGKEISDFLTRIIGRLRNFCMAIRFEFSETLRIMVISAFFATTTPILIASWMTKKARLAITGMWRKVSDDVGKLSTVEEKPRESSLVDERILFVDSQIRLARAEIENTENLITILEKEKKDLRKIAKSDHLSSRGRRTESIGDVILDCVELMVSRITGYPVPPFDPGPQTLDPTNEIQEYLESISGFFLVESESERADILNRVEFVLSRIYGSPLVHRDVEQETEKRYSVGETSESPAHVLPCRSNEAEVEKRVDHEAEDLLVKNNEKKLKTRTARPDVVAAEDIERAEEDPVIDYGRRRGHLKRRLIRRFRATASVFAGSRKERK